MNSIELKMLQYLIRKALDTKLFTHDESVDLGRAWDAVESVLYYPSAK